MKPVVDLLWVHEGRKCCGSERDRGGVNFVIIVYNVNESLANEGF